MRTRLAFAGWVLLFAGLLWLAERSYRASTAEAAVAQAAVAQAELAQAADAAKAIKAAPSTADEIKRLESLLPDQAHAMADVGYHFSNLWFAAQADNWPLAQFYANETKSHLHWAVRIKPIRKDSAGREIELEKILEALENSPLKQLSQAIEAKDAKQFEAAYRFTLEGCYSCHKASEKPYLRVRIPEAPEARMIQFDPTADWPK